MSQNSTTPTAQTKPSESKPILVVDPSASVPPEERDVELPSPISPSALDFGLREPVKIAFEVHVEVEQVVERSGIPCDVLQDCGVTVQETACTCSGACTAPSRSS